MDLQYLDFESSDDDAGNGSFDAMAAVRPERLPALLAELAAVLGWAWQAFGSPGVPADDGGWDCLLHAVTDAGEALAIAYDPAARRVVLAGAPSAGFTTVTCTLTGPPAFCEAFRARFPG